LNAKLLDEIAELRKKFAEIEARMLRFLNLGGRLQRLRLKTQS